MDEIITSVESGSSLLLSILEWTLLLTGLITATLLVASHRKSPPDHRALTQRIASRSWSTAQLGILFGTLLLLYALASFTGLFFYEEQIPLAQVVITLLIYSVIMILTAVIHRNRGDMDSSGNGLSMRDLKKISLAPVFYLAMLPFLWVVTKSYHLVLEHVFGMEIDLQNVAQAIQQEFSWLQMLYSMIALCIAPIYEELIFRGLLFSYLVKRTGLPAGTLVVSVIFAVMHYHGPSFVPLFLLSATLCLVYWRTGSLWVCIGMHALFNAVTVIALHLGG